MERDELNYLGKILWGYPSLVKKFDEGVRPALSEAREERRREREKAERQDTTTEHDGNDFLVPEVVSHDKNDTTPVPPQSSPTAPLDDEPEHLDMTKTGAQPDSHRHPDNHPPTLDEHALLTASGNIETFEPLFGDPIQMPDIEGSAAPPNEIEKANEGSRIAQSKEDSGE